jgi:glyoxylase-like metal-dependent hydrolase (beta-lactamase superfamily II)
MMTFGRFTLSLHNHGFLRLDGGSMFGTIPKAVWSRVMAADRDNRIALATRSILVETGDRKILVDVGTGGHWPAKFRSIYAVEHLPPREAGLDPEAVTDVVLSHLHFDHAGGILTAEGATAYPRARIHLQRTNLETARKPNPRERASYPHEIVDALERADVRLTDGSEEIAPEVWVHRSDGHTRGLQWLEVSDGGGAAVVFPSDMIPYSHHLSLPYTMGYDINAGKLLEEKEEFLTRAAAAGWLVVFVHDPSVPAARVQKDAAGRFSAGPTIEF